MSGWAKAGIALGLLGAIVIYFTFIHKNDDDLEFDAAVKKNTIVAYQEYLAGFLIEHDDDARERIGKLIKKARKTRSLNSGGALLDALAARGDPRVALVLPEPQLGALADQPLRQGDIVIAPIAPSFDRRAVIFSFGIAEGMTKVFEEAFGDRVIQVARPDALERDGAPGAPTMTIEWKVLAGGRLYGSPNSKRGFLSILLEVRATFATAKAGTVLEVSATVEPDPEFSFSTDMLGSAMNFNNPEYGSQDKDVYDGMVQSAFEQLARIIVADMSGTPVAPRTAQSPLEIAKKWCKERNDADSCVQLGFAHLRGDGVDQDRARAAELFEKGCWIGGAPQACVPLARLRILGDGVDPEPTRGHMNLEGGCKAWHAESCRLWAEIELREADEVADLVAHMPARETIRKQTAIGRLVKACNIGSPEACARAAGLFADSEPLLAAALDAQACAAGATTSCARKPIARKKPTVLGLSMPERFEVFDVRWTMNYELSEGLTVWVAADTLSDIERHYATQPDSARRLVMMYAYPTSDERRPVTAAPPPTAGAVAGFFLRQEGNACDPCPPSAGRGWSGMTGRTFCDCPK